MTHYSQIEGQTDTRYFEPSTKFWNMYDSQLKSVALSIFPSLKMYKLIKLQDINLCLSDLWKKGKRMEIFKM